VQLQRRQVRTHTMRLHIPHRPLEQIQLARVRTCAVTLTAGLKRRRRRARCAASPTSLAARSVVSSTLVATTAATVCRFRI
jgi:hypothetical protein